MSAFAILSTNHTSFTVSSLDDSVGVYLDVLGFELVSRAPRDPAIISAIVGVAGASVEVVYLRRPDHTVELIQYTAPADRSVVQSRPCDAGFAHLAFDVCNIDGAIEACRPYGFVPLSPPVINTAGPNKGAGVVYLRNGDGVTFEFIEKPSASAGAQS
ncbi:MAG: hypothetical protein JWP99_1196 [Devosia sp.]|nr:hypothetical protein [Devosia sp.]